MSTQAERREATQRALVASGRRLFAERGYAKVSIDEIAADAGVTRGALYHHFAGKEELFETVFRAEEARLRDEVIARVAPVADPREQLLMGCRSFIEFAARPSSLQVILVDGPAVLGWARYRKIDEEHFLELLVGAIAQLWPGDATEDNIMVGRALIAACCELACRHAEKPGDMEAMMRVLERLIARR